MKRHNVPGPLVQAAKGIDRLIALIGKAVIWLSLLLVLLQFAVVLLRYLFGIGSIWLSESVIYTHAALFLLAASWTLQQNGHARVDVLYAGASDRTKGLVDLLGSLLLLLPFMAAVLWYALPYAARSWSILEHSREISGLPIVYLLKTLMPAFAALMVLQGLSQAIRAALRLSMPPSQAAQAADPAR